MSSINQNVEKSSDNINFCCLMNICPNLPIVDQTDSCLLHDHSNYFLFSNKTKDKQKAEHVSMRKKNPGNKINKSDQLISSRKSASPLLSSCTEHRAHTILVKPSTHFLVCSIPKENISKIQQLYRDSATFPNFHITSYTNVKNPYVTLSSFHSLLTYGEPIDDSIFYSFFKLLRVTCPDCHTVDTNFHRLFMLHRWETTYRTFFIHAQNSNYSKTSNSKPSLNSNQYPRVSLGGPRSSGNCRKSLFYVFR
jgi:hypothetical protein